jgi:hypothetical protein
MGVNSITGIGFFNVIVSQVSRIAWTKAYNMAPLYNSLIPRLFLAVIGLFNCLKVNGILIVISLHR